MNLKGHPSKSLASMQTPSPLGKEYTVNRLPANHKLAQDSFIMSTNGSFFARLGEQGNLAVYKSSTFSPTNVIWSSQTHGKGNEPYYLIMQADANLVIYDRANKAVWASDTHKVGKFPCSLFLFDNGTLGIIDADHKLIWASSDKHKDNEPSMEGKNEFLARLARLQCQNSKIRKIYVCLDTQENPLKIKWV